MKNIGEGEDIRIEVRFPDDLTDEEMMELDKEVKGCLLFYREKVAAFRASRRLKHKPSDAQTADLQDAPKNRAPLLLCLLTGTGTLLSLSDYLVYL